MLAKMFGEVARYPKLEARLGTSLSETLRALQLDLFEKPLLLEL